MGLKQLPSVNGTVWVSEYLENHGVDHTGSTRNAIRFGLNKVLAKQRVLDAGLRSAKFAIVNNYAGYVHSDNDLDYPVFVKPAAAGGGFGIDAESVAYNLDELNSKLASLAIERPSGVIIEDYLPGREFSVSVLKDTNSDELRVMPIELVTEPDSRGNRVFGHKVKSDDKEIVTNVDDANIRAKVIELAQAAFIAIGGRDYGRIDIRLDARGEANFIEVNFIPSLLKDYGNFPKACQLNIGLGYDKLILQIVELVLKRRVMVDTDNITIDSPLLAPTASPVVTV